MLAEIYTAFTFGTCCASSSSTIQAAPMLRIVLLGLIGLVAATPPIVVPPSNITAPSTAPGIFDGPQVSQIANSQWQILTSNPIIGVEVAHVPGTDAYLYIGRTRDYGFTMPSQDIIAGVYNLGTRVFQNVTVTTNTFCGGMTLTHDGRLVAVGGTPQDNVTNTQPDGMKGLRVYDYKANKLSLPEVNTLNQKRWYPSATLMPDHTILINGGTTTASETGTPSKTFERWNLTNLTAPLPQFPYDPEFYNASGKLFYPSTFLLPTGEVFILQDQMSRIMKNDNTFRKRGDGSYLSAPSYPAQWKTQFPRIGTAIMTALSWTNGYSSVDIVMFGGAPTSNPCKPDGTAKTIPANSFSYRLKISWRFINGDWVYTFGQNWVEEQMGIPRVGGDAVLLPNGDVVLVGGAQTGCSCGIVGGVNRGNFPALWSSLYQPDRPSNKRYTILGASTVARVYHGTAVLTTDGTVLVQGSDAATGSTKTGDGGLISTAPFYNQVNIRYEYRVELFSPPYALDIKAKPKIITVNGVANGNTVVNLAYGQTFTITWQPQDATQTDIKVTGVSLVAPSATTHGFDANQRVVFLQIIKQDAATKTVTVQVPGNIAILPSQIYQLFIMNGKTYGRAHWVKLG